MPSTFENLQHQTTPGETQATTHREQRLRRKLGYFTAGGMLALAATGCVSSSSGNSPHLSLHALDVAAKKSLPLAVRNTFVGAVQVVPEGSTLSNTSSAENVLSGGKVYLTSAGHAVMGGQSPSG